MGDESGQLPGPVQNGDLPKTWIARARAGVGKLRAASAATDSPLARLLSDQQVSDDEIFEILNAGGNGKITADLCVAKGVTVPRYCVWKAKYRGLTLEALREVRRAELSRARRLVGVLVTAVALAAGGIVFALARAAQANITVGAGLAPAHLPAAATRMEGASLVAAAASAKAVRAATNPAEALAPAPTAAPGYNVQVVAAASLQQGRLFVERLAAAGHPAYVASAIVDHVEVFRVRVGPFDTRSEADEACRRLKRTGYAGAWIVR